MLLCFVHVDLQSSQGCVQEAVSTIPDWLADFFSVANLTISKTASVATMQYIPLEYLSLMSHFNHDKYIVSNSLLSGPSEQRKNGSHASSRSHLLTRKSPWPSSHHSTYSHGWCTHGSGHSDVWWCHDGKDSLLRVFKASFFLTGKLLQDWTCPSTIRHASTNCEKRIFLLLSQFAG